MVPARVLILAEQYESVHRAAAHLAAEGYEVHIATVTADGLMRLPAPWPDLVLIRFDEAPQPDLLAAIRHRWDVPLLVWAGSCERNQAVQALQAGADDYVSGPLALAELAARAAAHLRRARWRGPAAQTAWQSAC